MDLKTLKKFIDIEDARRLKKGYDDVDVPKRALLRMAKLTEEVGELADAVLAELGKQRKEKLHAHTTDKLADEFADVVITAFLLAKTLDVDVPASIGNKMKKIDERYLVRK